MAPVTEPFSISHIAGRYLLFDVDAVSHARREHNICGVLIGTIPNLSQQNVFLGLPLELMAEEARVLVEQGHAYIIDDVQTHREGFIEMNRADRLAFLQNMDQQGAEAASSTKKKAEDRTKRGLARALQEGTLHKRSDTPELTIADSDAQANEAESLFGSESTLSLPAIPEREVHTHYLTPTTSYPPLSHPSTESALPLPDVPRGYPLFRYMHSKGYFSMPGLRFGCHYSVYPGDPLRFHSHFLATGVDWDEEVDLLDIVGGGRLGTGVKKAYLIGGEDPSVKSSGKEIESADAEPVRAFSIEWAGF